MTGYGKSTCEVPNKLITIEIKCLNSKQADINIKLPSLYREGESDLRNRLLKDLIRGKIEMNLWYDITEAERKATINHLVVKDYLNQFDEMRSWTDIPGNEVLIPTIMRLPEVLRVERQEIDKSEWEVIMKAVDEAVNLTWNFRNQEGEALEEDIRLRINNIIKYSEEVVKFLDDRINQIKNRLDSNLTEFIGKDNIDKNRFEQEVIYYLEKTDITEERIRLKNHCSYFLETMEEESQVGKKLAFIAQEMGREINTLGAKANNGDIQKLVVQMKDELEKIREQLLNVL
jgi:uncharacterized protein (TIGR00255 family)